MPMPREFSLEEKLYLIMANHGRAHLLGMNLAKTEEEMESAALARAKELKHPLGPSDLCVGHTKLPDCPLIQFMVHHGVDHVLGRDTASSEAELMKQAKEFSEFLGRPANDGDFSLLICNFATWILSLR